ncbi:hypothetical protein BO78DRAFT_233960 [Aspergillus sclerotiicarbonarius CBS 121057]|uniref:Secreted protein n=1 Tax=Aspergillus sclerotiicarbonarius (strain CBS 121057 / IBT 28362) TaxID=1448318 RepID=A0A319ELE2_ASPSB|nr:hypothetical protein BO78DRAFT_233960 [Aspergillus sclerotiicarbonarius CBS 121057]
MWLSFSFLSLSLPFSPAALSLSFSFVACPPWTKRCLNLKRVSGKANSLAGSLLLQAGYPLLVDISGHNLQLI